MERMTKTRREQLIETYVETVVEHMDLGELMLYAQEQMAMGMDHLTDEEVLEDITSLLACEYDDDEIQKLYRFTKEENAIIDEINEKKIDEQVMATIRDNGGMPL